MKELNSSGVDVHEKIVREWIYYGIDATLKSIHIENEIIYSLGAIGADPRVKWLISEIVTKGILLVQHMFANSDDDLLGYEVLNGAHINFSQVKSYHYKKSEVSSIEIFSDGYVVCPNISTVDKLMVSYWEDSHANMVSKDYECLDECRSVKGNMSDENFDDRSILILIK